MVTCKHCSTPNSLDSTFCKRCGTALPADDVLIAQERLTALIAEGNTAFNEGKTDEAMAIAESACASNPSSTPALALKALCFERKGQLAEALECADMIVDLNPDSELDKIKRNQLRTKLSVSAQLAAQPPDRRTALIGATAAVILVVCLGIGAAKYSNRNALAKQDVIVAQNPPTQTYVPPTTGGTQPSGTNPNPNVVQSPVRPDPPQNTYDPGNTDSQLTLPPRKIRGPIQPGLPNPDDSGTGPGVITIGSTVMPPSQPATPATTFKKPTVDSSAGSGDPAPSPDATASIPPQNTGPGTIEINVSKGGRKTIGGGTESFGAGGAEALDRIGIQRYQLGSFGSAASSFEQALHAGGDPARLNQWLGKCYGNMGKKSEQIDAYKRSVAACQSAINSGSGNKDRLKAILDTCQQELKVLQGN